MEKIMRYRLNRLSIRAKLIAGALALVIAGLSHASGTQVGGGATLPAILYVGSADATLETPQVAGTNIDPHSLFGVYDSTTGNTSSYCLTGSGSGKNILAGFSNNNVQNICATSTSGTTTLHGFGAAAVGRTDLTQPNFVGTDAPLNATDYSNYKFIHTAANANPIEFPVVAGSVAIVFNLVDNTGAQVTSSEVNFTDLQLCLIFSGEVSNWSDPWLTRAPNNAFNLPTGHFILSAPINVQYRADNSGTSFSLSNHLATVCNANIKFNGPVFETSQTFFPVPGIIGTLPPTYVVQNFFTYVNNPAVNDGLPNGDGTTTPKWTGWSNGDEEVAIAVRNTANSIGYVETANALLPNPSPQIADVNGTNPITNFNVSAIIPLSLAFNKVISDTNNADGTAALATITPVLATRCIAIVRPAEYAAPRAVLGSIVPVGSYPIVAVSYFLGNSVGNGTDLAATQGLVTSPYNSTITSQVTPVSGLQFIALHNGAFTSSQVSGCYGL